MKYVYEVECNAGNGLVGQTVKVVNDHAPLTLCEVKVNDTTSFILIESALSTKML